MMKNDEDYPEIVPILEAKELCIGPYKKGKDCGCLLYWTDRVFIDWHFQNIKGPHKELIEAKTDRVRQQVQRELYKVLGTYVTGWHDEPYNGGNMTTKKIAIGWNKAMRALGYTVPCDRS